MSHYYVLALISPEDAERDLEGSVMELMAPFDENREMPPKKELVSDEDWQRFLEFYEGGYKQTYPEGTEKRRRIEQMLAGRSIGTMERKDLIDVWEDWSGEPLHFDEQGRPFVMTTYNEEGHWDWFQIGGRWTGVLDGYKPGEDPKNWERCFLCGGTGKRPDFLTFELRNPGWMERTGGCNACNGTGTKEKWPTEWEMHEGDVQPARKVLEQIRSFEPREPTPEEIEENKKDPFMNPLPPQSAREVPYAMVTYDGWHSKGETGMFMGIRAFAPDEAVVESGLERPRDEWDMEVMRLLAMHSEAEAVVVDCHT